MISFVLDASAVLAFLNKERGFERVEELIPHGVISAVNVTEVLTRLIDLGQPYADATENFDCLTLRVIDLDLDHARKAAELRVLTRRFGLSLGDRCCLALAATFNATAVTADRNWKSLSFCQVELIR